MSGLRRLSFAVASFLAVAGCSGGDDTTAADFCASRAYTPPASSPYRLPYAVGTSFTMFQGNCPPNPAWGHHGKFAYDFEMPLGTPVLAMRAGTVVFTIDIYSNDDHTPGHENSVWVMHDDGTVSDYEHLSPGTVVVLVGAGVQQGDMLGLSGDSGGSDRPHLHVGAYADNRSFDKPNSIPITFSNAGGVTEPSGELIQDNAYTAQP